MKGDAVPVRYSRRIKGKAKDSSIKMFPKKNLNKSPVKKRTSKVNSSLCITKEKPRLGMKKKSVESSKQTSKFLRLSSRGLSSRKSLNKVCDQKRKTNSLNASQANLLNNKASLKNLDLSNSKKVEKKEKHEKIVKNGKQSVRRSLRLLKSSSLLEENVMNEEPNNSDLKTLKERNASQKKSTKQVTTLSSKLVLSQNPKKSKRISKDGRKKSSVLSTGLKNQSSIHIPASKLLNARPVPGTVNRPTRLSSSRESGRFLKRANRSKIINTDSFYTPSFHSLLETPQPENNSEKRKSSRLSESSPLRTLNKELSFSTPASVLKINSDSTLDKSLKSCKGSDPLPSESQSRKKGKPKDGCAASQKKRKGSQHQKILENSSKPLSNETENLPLDVLTTPAFVPPCERSRSKKFFSKSDSKASKRKLIASASKNEVTSEELQDAKKRRKSADFSKVPGKGTLKRKRWLLKNLEQNNGSYEDDIFENRNKPAFHFGDESDGSSVNIATPKFDCILTPALPKKTPRFKDCISPTEFLQARKSAEEYLFRRNKKRKSGNRQSSSGKKINSSKMDTAQDIPEKMKLDFTETVNKLVEVQRGLDIEAEIDDEEEDSYFSDASN